MPAHHLCSPVPQALPAPVDRADPARRSRRAPRPAALLLLIPVLFAVVLMPPPRPGFADYRTPYTSEELPPIGCDPGSLISSVYCTGRYCDNVAFFCKQLNDLPRAQSWFGARTWSPFISDESPHTHICPFEAFITGLACKGSYCDSLSVECYQQFGRGRQECYWTGWVSEEGSGTLSFPAGYYAAGLKCWGAYCDYLSFYVCRAV